MKYFLSFLLISLIIIGQDLKINVNLTKKKYSDLELSHSVTGDQRLLVKVNYPSGTPVEKLTKYDFFIEENGYPAEIISVEPLSESVEVKMKIFLCIDNSASMDRYVDDLLDILDDLVDKLPRSADITLITFDSRYSLNKFIYKGDYLNINYSDFYQENWKLKQSYHSKFKQQDLSLTTNLYDQMLAAFALANRSQYNDNEMFYIVLSDGRDIGSSVNSGDALNSFRKGKVFAIDFSRNSKIDFLEELTNISGGELFSARNTEELKGYFQKIGENIIFRGYEINYKSTRPPQLFLSNLYQFKNSQKINVSKITIEEVKSREFFPLLNYVFFDKSSAELPERYRTISNEETFNFDEKNLLPNQMIIYSNILNIIGSRLRKYPEAVLSLVGCNDNKGDERGNKNLSKKRAVAVKDYLLNIWGIDESRLKVQTRNLPRKYSNTKKEYGHEENRRVELYSDQPEIFDVVEAYSISKITDPESILMNYQMKTNYEIKRWNLKVTQNDQVIYTKEDTGKLPDQISWNIAPSLVGKEISSDDFLINLVVEDELGRLSNPYRYSANIDFISSERKSLEKLSDKTIEKLSLVLFDFNSSDLDPRNKRILGKIENSINNKSILYVKGYTDSSGDENLNKKLSESRAKNTLNSIIKVLNPEVSKTMYEGLGEWTPLYDNDLPEGRFYNRTCQIVIENPIGN